MNIQLFQIYFDAKSKKTLDKLLIAFYNIDKAFRWFENDVLRRLFVKNKFDDTADYCGVTSWRLTEKTGFTAAELFHQIQQDKTPVDCYFYSTEYLFCKRPKISDIGFHKEWITALNNAAILPYKIDIDILDGANKCYCNYFLVRPHILKDYIKTVLIPAMYFFDNSNACKKLREQTVTHRGIQYPVAQMVMELQFAYYMYYMKISNKHLMTENIKNHMVKFIDTDTGEVFHLFNNQKISESCLKKL